MSSQKVTFNRNITGKNMENFSFKFEGTKSNSNSDIKRINKLLDDFINLKSHRNMIKNVAFIRTILKEFEEKLLVIEYIDQTSQEYIKYNNGNLTLFKSQNCENKNLLTTEFTSEKSLNVSFSDYDKSSIIDYPDYDNISQQFSKLVKHINILKNIKPVYLDMDSKALIEIYKLFYNENPDFSLPNINIKIQTMMSILVQFGISLGDDYSFSMWRKTKMPLSLNLEQLVNKLFPLGEINDIENPIKLAEESKNIIKIVGENIRKTINEVNNKDEALITISKVIYATRYSLSSNSIIRELSDFANCTPNEVESSIRLIKRIETKLIKDK